MSFTESEIAVKQAEFDQMVEGFLDCLEEEGVTDAVLSAGAITSLKLNPELGAILACGCSYLKLVALRRKLDVSTEHDDPSGDQGDN